jgi:fermentation-respiration switch protein FrsA (DUF1100 family)
MNSRAEKEKEMPDNYIFDLDEDVTRTPVSYKNRFGITIAADLYRPKDSGGFLLSAAQVDRRLKAVATVSMVDIARTARCGIQDTLTEEDRNAFLDVVAEQRYAEFEGNPPALTPRGAPIGFDARGTSARTPTSSRQTRRSSTSSRTPATWICTTRRI